MSQNRRPFAGIVAAATTAHLSIGVVLAILAMYVRGPLGSSDLAVVVGRPVSLAPCGATT